MKPRSFFLAGMMLVFGMLFSQSTFAQETPPADPQKTPAERQQAPNPQAQLLRRLNLTPEQIEQIRQINRERKPIMELAQVRFRNANRALDEAIYADVVNDADIHVKLKEAQLAQAEVMKGRSVSELAIRRVLTPDQLVKFRQMRARFAQRRALDAQQKQRQQREDRQKTLQPQPPKQTPPKPI